MWGYRCFDTHIKDNRSTNSLTASTNKKKTCFLVLDQGTSSTKSFLFDIQGTLEHSAKIKHSLTRPAPYHVECDPITILEACRSLIDQALSVVKAKGGTIQSMGLAVQRSTFLFWERKSMEPRTQALSWQDSRAHSIIKDFEPHQNQIKRITGTPLSAHFGGPKFLHCLIEDRTLKQEVLSGNILFGPLSAFLTHALTGTPAVDESIACRSLLFNLSTGKWSKKLLDLFQVPRSSLPELVPIKHSFGTIVPGNIQLQCVVGDQQAALIGQGGRKIGTLAMNFGTSGSVQFNVGDRPVLVPGLISSILTSSNTNRMFMVEGTINACNSLFYHLEKELNIPHKQMHWHKRCQERKTNGVFIPGFTGLAAPYWISGFPDIYEGIDTSDPNDIIRAGMESIGFLTYDILEQIKTIATSWPKKLTASGGGARPPLLQFIADLTNLPVCHSTMKDRTAYGVYQLIRPKEKNLSKLEESYFNLTLHPSLAKDQQKSKVNCWHKALGTAGLIKNGQ